MDITRNIPRTDNQAKWDRRFMDIAINVSSWSKDPSTQTGAVIVDEDNRIVSTGFNGFPKGVNDDINILNNREEKYKRTIHCEVNAIIFANKSVKGCTIYIYPFLCCVPCATVIIQSGIKRVVAPTTPETTKERWEEELNAAYYLLREAKVDVRIGV